MGLGGGQVTQNLSGAARMRIILQTSAFRWVVATCRTLADRYMTPGSDARSLIFERQQTALSGTQESVTQGVEEVDFRGCPVSRNCVSFLPHGELPRCSGYFRSWPNPDDPPPLDVTRHGLVPCLVAVFSNPHYLA
jgi:hypothetical protein